MDAASGTIPLSEYSLRIVQIFPAIHMTKSKLSVSSQHCSWLSSFALYLPVVIFIPKSSESVPCDLSAWPQ